MDSSFNRTFMLYQPADPVQGKNEDVYPPAQRSAAHCGIISAISSPRKLVGAKKKTKGITDLHEAKTYHKEEHEYKGGVFQAVVSIEDGNNLSHQQMDASCLNWS